MDDIRYQTGAWALLEHLPGGRYVRDTGDVPCVMLPDGRSIVTDGDGTYDLWNGPQYVKASVTLAEALTWAGSPGSEGN